MKLTIMVITISVLVKVVTVIIKVLILMILMMMVKIPIFFSRGTATLLSAFAYRHLSLSVYLGFWVLAFWSSFFFLLSIVCSVFRLLELCVLVSAVIRVFVFSCVSMFYVLIVYMSINTLSVIDSLEILI